MDTLSIIVTGALIFVGIHALLITFEPSAKAKRRTRKWARGIFEHSFERKLEGGYRVIVWYRANLIGETIGAAWMLLGRTDELIAQGTAVSLTEAKIEAIERYELEISASRMIL